MRSVESSPTGTIGWETVPLRCAGSTGAEELTIVANQYRHHILRRIGCTGCLAHSRERAIACTRLIRPHWSKHETTSTIPCIVPPLDYQSRHPVSAPPSPIAVVLASFSNSPE